VLVHPERRVDQHIDGATGALVQQFGDEDALDELCASVLSHGGSVFVHAEGGAEGLPDLIAEMRG
jgi:hypothetical protein